MMASVKAKQDDLRRLMKERRENLLNQKNRIDSPFAKYNNLGQLSCTICNIQIKNNALWATHVAGKTHKENALKKKKGSVDVTSKVVPQVKEKQFEMQPPAAKKMKMDVADVPPKPAKSELVKSSQKVSLLDAYSSSEDEDDSEPMDVSSSVSNNGLPKDFFDAAPTSSYPINEEKPKTEENKPALESLNSVEALPEGFFDDPVQDAKARNIEYKDPIEEEWERYQKAIAEETNVSKTIIEEDLEVSTLERDLVEIDVQMSLWEKAKTLQTLAEEASTKVPSTNENDGLSGSTDDELDEDDLLDWRSKGVKKI